MLGDATEPYCGTAPSPADLFLAWNMDPVLIATLGAAFLWGMRIIGRDDRNGDRRSKLYLGAFAILFLAFVSPVCALSSALFSARIVHHLLLIAVAAPLLAMAFPRRKTTGAFGLSAWVVAHLLAVWIWHAPQPYAAALDSHILYWVMELTLLGTGLALWRELLAPGAPVARTLFAHLTLIVQMGLLGALITFAPQPLYVPHFLTTGAFGLSALEDQQLAGLIMWVPAILPYLVAALATVTTLLRDDAFAERPSS